MKTVKEATYSLLSKGEITKEQYDHIEKTGAFGIDPKKLRIAARKFKANSLRFGIPLGGLAVAGAIAKEDVIDPVVRAIKIRNSFNAMREKVPALEGKSDDDIKDYFSVVKTFSPKSASNPLVAGALVNKMMEFGGVDHKLVQDISAIEQGFQTPSVRQTATEAAAKAIVSNKA